MRNDGHPEGMEPPLAKEVRFPPSGESGTVRGMLERPEGAPLAGLILTHGRSNDMRHPFLRRLSSATAEAGVLALRMNFRYVDEKAKASRDLSREERDLRGAVEFLQTDVPGLPIFVAGKSMGARVCARASDHPAVRGIIALGYPLHPMFRPQVRDPPEWPMIAKPALFVQGDQDPFCDLARLREELPRLKETHDLLVIPDAGHSFEPKGPKRDTFPEVWDAVWNWIRRRITRADSVSLDETS
jgi:predicted alpha/beta-hydrolase family hydrolase